MAFISRTTVLLALLSSVAVAQKPAQVRIPAGTRVCDMSARVLTLRVRDRRGAPVSGAAITVTRVASGAAVERIEALSDGEYKLVEDGSLTGLRSAGEPFDVRLTSNGRTRRYRLTIGLTTDGCHVRYVPPTTGAVTF